MSLKTLNITPNISVAFVGPPLEEGPLPALFYFALSKEESLKQDPFNQPVVALASLPMRIFSMTLPGHGPDLPAVDALKIWAKEIGEGHDIIEDFCHDVLIAVQDLIKQNILISDKIAVAGLSRGAFIATHVAAKIPYINSILGFAPLTHLSNAKEFSSIKDNPLVLNLSLPNLIDTLTERSLRYYIGNRDVLVGTALCFHFIEELSDAAFLKKRRSSQYELIIGPSIGTSGHGTSPAVFKDGALWVASQLGVVP